MTILKNRPLEKLLSARFLKRKFFWRFFFNIPDTEKNLGILKDDTFFLTLKDFLNYHEAQISLSFNERAKKG
ncbi:MAG: hypothetical protein R2874_14870 [Desulfobacterales bacterium]